MKQVAKLGFILALICALSGLGLAAVYAKTKPIIEKRAEEDLLNGALEVLPGASSIEQQELDGTVYWLGKSGAEVVGAAMQVESQGYGANPIQMMVGVGSDGKISKVKIIALSETPGIGSRVDSEVFLSKFSGIDNPAGVDGISGATVSSGAVKGGVGKAFDFLSEIVGPGREPVIDIASIPDGTYEGTGEGLFGAIKVSVAVQGGKITEVKVLEHSETEGIADAAISRVPDAIIEKQTVDVDAVSGATYTSKGIIDAVKDALMAFAMDTGNIDVSKLADGTYEGTGEGLFGAIKVSVTVQGGKITEVKVLEHGETDGIADAAISGVSNAIVETQDPNVDAVSGATFTSKGIIEAVKNALTGAKQE